MDDALQMDCPRCGEALQGLRLGVTSVHECAACGGLWVDPDSLQKLCDAREEHSSVVSALEARVPTKPVTPDTVRYIPCPVCKKLMNRVNFAHTSGVIMDVCKSDGVWLDRGELQRVVGFVEHGGLSAAREHERAQLEDERKRLVAARAGSATIMPEAQVFTWTHTSSRPSADSPVDQLLRDALNLFIK